MSYRWISLIGGMHDGLRLKVECSPDRIWIDSDLCCWSRERPGRQCYRATEPLDGAGLTYIACQVDDRECERCGVIHARCDEDGMPIVQCHLCGAEWEEAV